MGRPVRILDLTRNLILLSGLRPGSGYPHRSAPTSASVKKLYEELSTLDEETSPYLPRKDKDLRRKRSAVRWPVPACRSPPPLLRTARRRPPYRSCQAGMAPRASYGHENCRAGA